VFSLFFGFALRRIGLNNVKPKMGKKTRMRLCPAAGRHIESFECAEGRHITFACPDGCPFNPFATANYDQYLNLERVADEKLLQWMAKRFREEQSQQLRARLGSGPNAAFFQYLSQQCFYERNTEGKTFVETWAENGFSGLSSDERIVMRARVNTRPALVEVHRIQSKTVEGIDLLDPARNTLRIVDQSFALHAVRFGVYGLDLCDLPHFTRIMGTATELPQLPPFEPEYVVHQLIAHLGGVSETSEMRSWLRLNGEQFLAALRAVGLARRKLMFDNLNAQFGKAVYELAAPFEKCRQRLDEDPNVAEDAPSEEERAEGFVEGRVWFATKEDPEYDRAGEGATLGVVLLGKTHWRLQGMGSDQLEKLRARFEAVMGDRVRFAGQRLDDLGARMRAKDPAFDASLVPPSLLEYPQKLATTVSRIPLHATAVSASPGTGILSQEELIGQIEPQREIEFLDEQVPALDGKTPRQAVSDPVLRGKLIALMKYRICECDRANLQSGGTVDINWMIRELGLTEILFDPPPRRPVPPQIRQARVEDDLGDEFSDDESLPFEEPEFLTLPPPPPLPELPWTDQEVLRFFEKATETFPEGMHALDYFYQLEYPLFDDVEEITESLLKDDDYALLTPVLAVVMLCFAPHGTRPPEIHFDRLKDRFHEAIAEMVASSEREGDSQPWWQSSPQPHLLSLAHSVILQSAEAGENKINLSRKAKAQMFLVLYAVIAEADKALRRRMDS
jgi:hypothetical protein